MMKAKEVSERQGAYPFHTMVLALNTASEKILFVFSPTSKPCGISIE